MQNEDERRRARKHWPISVVSVADAVDDLSATTTAEARLAMMWPLAIEAFSLSQKTIPTYDRRHAPSRVFRPGEHLPEDA